MNTAPATAAPMRASLYDVVAQLDRHFGPGFVHSTDRWDTVDGGIPFRQVPLFVAQMQRQLAAERLHLARAMQMANGGQAVAGVIRDDERVAHGLS